MNVTVHERLSLKFPWKKNGSNSKYTWRIYTHIPVSHRKLSLKKNTKATSAAYYVNSQSVLYTQTLSIN